MYIIGITGKMGSGKSTSAALLKKVLSPSIILDADIIAKDIYKTCPDILVDIRNLFGTEVFCSDGTVDYRILAKRVFSSRNDLDRLNGLMFPKIEQKIQKLIKRNSGQKFLILDAAILFNSNIYKFCNYIILVRSGLRNRRNFLLEKTGLSCKEIDIRLKGQYIKIRRKMIDCIIENDHTMQALEKKVKTAAACIAALEKKQNRLKFNTDKYLNRI